MSVCVECEYVCVECDYVCVCLCMNVCVCVCDIPIFLLIAERTAMAMLFRKSDLAHYKDLSNEQYSFLKFDEMELFQPTEDWVLKRTIDRVEKKLSARDLKMGTHFRKQNLSAVQGGKEAIKEFIESFNSNEWTIGSGTRKISHQIMHISTDICESSSMLCATYSGEIYKSKLC